MNDVSIKMNLLGLVLGPLVVLAVFLMGRMIVMDVGARVVLALVA